MFKKIIWTLILTTPFWLSSIFLAIDLAFNTTLVENFDVKDYIFNWNSLWYSLGALFSISSESNIFDILWIIIVIAFWFCPFWYLYKGTWFMLWIPKVGWPLRILLIIISFFYLPLLIVISLIGLWIKG